MIIGTIRGRRHRVFPLAWCAFIGTVCGRQHRAWSSAIRVVTSNVCCCRHCELLLEPRVVTGAAGCCWCVIAFKTDDISPGPAYPQSDPLIITQMGNPLTLIYIV
jgi:hypothetical protein